MASEVSGCIVEVQFQIKIDMELGHYKNNLVGRCQVEKEESGCLDPGELKQRMEKILETVEEEREEMKIFYTQKISELYDEIWAKDSQIALFEEKLQNLTQKHQDILDQLTKKEQTIRDLTIKVSSFEKRFKQNLHTYIEQFNFTFSGGTQKEQEESSLSKKKINISEYFMKNAQKSKDITKSDYDISSQNSTFSTLYSFPSGKIYIPELKTASVLKKSKNSEDQHARLSRLLENQADEFVSKYPSQIYGRFRNSGKECLRSTNKHNRKTQKVLKSTKICIIE